MPLVKHELCELFVLLAAESSGHMPFVRRTSSQLESERSDLFDTLAAHEESNGLQGFNSGFNKVLHTSQMEGYTTYHGYSYA